MDRCPHCGVELDARLVAAIRNPSMEESCPKVKPVKRTPERWSDTLLMRLAAAILREELGE